MPDTLIRTNYNFAPAFAGVLLVYVVLLCATPITFLPSFWWALGVACISSVVSVIMKIRRRKQESDFYKKHYPNGID